MKLAVVFYCLGGAITLHAQRSIHRPRDPLIPSIEVWSNIDAKHYQLTDPYLRPVPLLRTFDKKHFEQHLIAAPGIWYENHTRLLSHETITALINSLLQEIKQGKKVYSNFIILKNSGFARHKKCGLLIAKFKNYPFVLKLFIETPHSFVNPYGEGFEVACIFSAGGSLRHTLGFSRIKTLDYVRTKIAQDAHWRERIIMPRKWFWLPKNPCWLHIKTHHLGPRKTEDVEIPSLYGLIADELIKDPVRKPDYNELMAFSKLLEHRIDPHTKNFFIEKNTGKIAVIDTELFPLILGFNERISPRSTHINWYIHLAGKFVYERLGSTKSARRIKRQSLQHYYVS